ncbi:MAG: SDR family NAD(P)-dependent oxidoreductase [Deltaproteobacteria bacterium]|nr:MAG: SDR family NAD(P)-dependent oxidoreductase [Deltaproteobacteria bacterium]
MLDGALQSVAVLVDAEDSATLVPAGCRTLDVYASLAGAVHAVVHRRSGEQFDIDVTDATGLVLVRVAGLVLRPVPRPVLRIEPKVFVPVWRAAKRPTSPPAPVARAAVIHAPAMTALAWALRRSMSPAETVLVPYGDDGAEDLTYLRKPFDRICFVASADPDAPPARDVAVLFRVVEELIAAGRDRAPLTLQVVTCGAVATAADEPAQPHAAALIGLTRSIAAEYPQWRAGVIDLGDLGQLGRGGSDLEDAAHRVVAEDCAMRLVAMRGARRLVRGVAPVTLPLRPRAQFRERGAYILLGGAGGIGFALSRYLARRYRAHVAWIGRRVEDAEIRNRITAVSQGGGDALYLRADATDAAQLAAAVAEARSRFGVIHGAVHSAAVLRDRMLANMTRADLDDVLGVKLAGSVNLHRALIGEPLDFLVFFSSAAALIDSAGQANYAAASTFEDAYAGQLRRAGVPATIVNWGYWGSVGAVANAYHRSLLAAAGVGSLEPEVAFEALERVLGMEQVLVIEATAKGLTHFGIAEAAPTVGAPDAAAYVRRVFAEVLRFDEHELDDRSTFEQFGIDSVIGSQIVARLSRDLGALPSTLLFEEMTIERLANRLLADQPDELAAAVAPGAAAVATGDAAPSTAAASPDNRHAGSDLMTAISVVPRVAPAANDDVAVIGVAGRYPGAPDLAAFWCNLVAGISSIREVPPDRWDWRQGSDAKQGTRSWQRWAGFLDDVAGFDALLFGVLPRDAANIDPQERLFLETCWSLLEQTGYLGASHEPDTGVFAGLMYGTYGEIAAQAWSAGELSGAHSAYWSVANRVSYTFDLHGPSLAVDTACSSSLTAVHLACESIRRGDCRTAIAGGVNLVLHPAHLASLGARNMLAPDGIAKVFDASANGYVPGEGVGAVLLKSLSAAIADGDDVWAVIRGGAWNAGGKTGGYTVPNPNAQATLIETALRRARVEPHTISYVEAHGTGTELGDPIEIAALARALHLEGEPGAPCAFGSVKSNIGHLEGAAGIAGLTKVLLQLRHRQLAPTLHLTMLNPKIDLRGTPFVPQTALSPWPGERGPRRAGVSSFGAGGANVHLVVEEWAADRPPRPVTELEHVIVLSAPTRDRLAVYAEAVAAFVESAPAKLRLADLAYTSQLGRRAFDQRLAVVASSLAELAVGLRSGAPREASNPALRALAAKWIAGEHVDWRTLWPAPARRIAFPGIPLDRKPYWLRDAPSTAPATHVRYERAVWTPAGPAGEARLVHRVLVVASDRGLADAVQRRLTESGIAVVADVAALPDAVVHVTGGDLDRSAPDRQFHDVFELAIDLLRRTRRAPLRLVCAYVARRGEEQPHLAALAGLVRMLTQEDRRCTGVCVALEAGPPDALSARIVEELRSGGDDLDVAWRNGVRWVRTLQSFVPAVPATDYVVADAAYQRGAGDVVLVGRSPRDERISARIAELRRGRTRIRYERADVTCADDLERTVAGIRRTAGPLRGVIHAAGSIRDARAVDKTPEQIAAVLGPKITGALNLDRVTADDPLDFFVLFSSLVGQTGNPGQTDYAYANAFLDAFAETRQRWCMAGSRRGRTLSIGWPLWRDGGMRVDDATARLLEQRWGMW